MKKKFSIKPLLILMFTTCLILFSLTLYQPSISLTQPSKHNRIVLVTNQGEITEDTRYPGENVRFKIYYKNETKKTCKVVITDTLHVLYTKIAVLNKGVYDNSNHTIRWEVKNVAPGEAGAVEFTAYIDTAALPNHGPVTNEASIYFHKFNGFSKTTTGKKTLGRRVITNLVIINICIEPKLGWIPFTKDAKPGDRPKKVLKDETTTGTMIYFEIPGMFVKKVYREGRIYHKISIPTLSLLGDLGKPELPVIGKAVEIPRNVTLGLKIHKEDSVSFDCYNVLPAQIPEPEKAVGPVKKFIIDPATYSLNALYPEKPVFIAAQDDAIMRGHRVIFPKVSPIRFNPVTKELIAYSKIEVRVEYNTPAQIERIDNRLVSPVFENILAASVENFKGKERFREDEADPGDYKKGCDYLIITPSAFYNPNDTNNPIRRLCEWKHRKGLLTAVETIENIGNTDANIRNFMQNAYNTWNPVPTYVILIGDSNHIIPEYRTEHLSDGHRVAVGTVSEHRTLVGTDLYYAALDGSDYFPDVILSRISVNNTTDVENIIDKILRYEQNPPTNANFYSNTSLVRLFEDDNPINGTEDDTWILIELAEIARNYLINAGYNADRIYNFSGGYPGDLASGDPAGPQRWENGSALPNDLTQQPPTVFGWAGNTNDVANAFNSGNFMITYRGHGVDGATGWGNPSFQTAQLGLLNQNNMTPAVFSPTCQSGWFDDETDDSLLPSNNDCFAEEILRLDGRGAIGVIASSRNSWGAQNNPMLEGMFDALWPDFDAGISGGYLPRLGQIITYCKTFMAQTVPADTHRLIAFEMTHLFGDPELPIWTEAPGDIEVEHTNGIGSTGKQDFIVKVTDKNTNAPVQSAVVSLTRPGGILSVVQTDFGGYAYFSVTDIGPGEIDITVTSVSYRPYTGKIDVLASGAHINVLNPEDGGAGHTVYIGGINFSGNEQVDIYFGSQLIKTVDASAGNFGQSNDVTFDVPAGASVGPVTIIAKGKISGRYATDIFKVRTANAVELLLYSQWDETTWSSYPGDNPIWNNPDIWLEDTSGNPVASNNLAVNGDYIVKARVHNSSSNNANAVRVTFKWSEFGVGQQVWTDIGNSAPIIVNNGSSNIAQIEWTPIRTGHICVTAEIFHAEDVLNQNNKGQENCHVGPTASPAVVKFQVCNPTDSPAMVFLELRQVGVEKVEQEEKKIIWGSMIEHPDPQLLKPGECRIASVMIDPDLAKDKVNSGQVVKFVLTAFINGEMVGGADFDIKKK